jgi:Leucine-rich repeat (LRR) protein
MIKKIFSNFIFITFFVVVRSTSAISQYSKYYDMQKELKNDIYFEAVYDVKKANESTKKLTFVLGVDKAFPSFVYNLKNLEVLRFGRPYNSKACPMDYLSDSINQLINLRYLTINDLPITIFPLDLSGLENLLQLEIKTGQEVITSLPDFKSLKRIQSLLIYANPKFNLSSAANFESILENKHLKKILLSEVKLSPTMADQIQNLDSLVSIELSNNDIIALRLGKQKNLQFLSIFSNPIVTVDESIYSLDSLKILNFTYTQIKNINPKIANLKELKELNLEGSPIEKVPAEIAKLSKLETLTLRSTNVSEIPSEIFQIKSLKRLDLLATKMTNLPEGLVNSNIEELNISNVTSGEFFLDVEIIKKMPNLKTLQLDSRKSEVELIKQKEILKKELPNLKGL